MINMEKTIPSYMVSLSENSFEKLEELFEFQYSKFIYVYWLINGYYKETESLKFKTKSDGEILKIDLVLSDKFDVKPIIADIKNNIDDDTNIKISHKKNVINIEISKNEF